MTDADLPPARKWMGLAVASGIGALGFWSVLFAILVEDADEIARAGLALVSVVAAAAAFYALARVVRHPDATYATAMATAIAVLVTAVLVLVTPVPVVAVAALGGGAMAVVPPAGRPYRIARLGALAAVSLYTWFVLLAVPAFAVFFAPLFPFNALGLADFFVDRRVARYRLGD